MAQEIELAYGRHGRSFALPDNAELTIIRKVEQAAPADGARIVADALANPVGAETVAAEARRAVSRAGADAKACIVICDITRPVPNGLLLRPLIEQLIVGGITAGNIVVLVATGLHRPNEGDELAELVGDPWVAQTVRVVNHNARDDAAHINLGVTKTRQTPIILDRLLVEADVRIVTGLVEPHFMAGYSGGRKVVAPGVAHHTTIRTFHSARFMEHPAARTCNLDGNPLHEEQLEIIRALGTVLAVNVVLNDRRELIYANYGEVVRSHLAAVDVASKGAEVPVSRRFHTIVTSAAGYPLDKTYYQTVKGMVTPLDLLHPGGTLLIVSDCSEGIGSPEYKGAQQRLLQLGQGGFVDSLLTKNLADIDEWQTEMQVKSTRVADVGLYSDALGDAHRLTGVRRVEDLHAAVVQSIVQHGDTAVAVIPEGPYVVPFYAGA